MNKCRTHRNVWYLQSDNLKSKIQNPKWMGLVAIVLLLMGLVRLG